MGDREPVRCRVCGAPATAPLCSITCRAGARDEIARNRARVARLRELGFDARVDEVQAVVRRNAELIRALDDPTLVHHPPVRR